MFKRVIFQDISYYVENIKIYTLDYLSFELDYVKFQLEMLFLPRYLDKCITQKFYKQLVKDHRLYAPFFGGI
jgi:hypothetical protein